MNFVYPVIANQQDLPFYLTGIGISDPEYHVKRKTGLVSYQILFTKTGRGKIVVDGNTHILKEGSVFLIEPNVEHEYYPIEDRWETYWVVFRGQHLKSIMKSLGFKRFQMNNCVLTELPFLLFNRILTVAQEPIDSTERCSELLYELILVIRKLLFASPGEYTGTGSIVKDAVSYINKNFSSKITLQDLATLTDVSCQHFCRVFKAKMKMRPLEYLALRRVAEAKKLLSITAHSVLHIGELVGYPDPTYFGVVFKKYEGISPLEYRQTKNTLSL